MLTTGYVEEPLNHEARRRLVLPCPPHQTTPSLMYIPVLLPCGHDGASPWHS